MPQKRKNAKIARRKSKRNSKKNAKSKRNSKSNNKKKDIKCSIQKQVNDVQEYKCPCAS